MIYGLSDSLSCSQSLTNRNELVTENFAGLRRNTFLFSLPSPKSGSEKKKRMGLTFIKTDEATDKKSRAFFKKLFSHL